MNPRKVNERWRVALAGLIAALAIPILAFDTPGTAEGAETANLETADLEAHPVAPPEGDTVLDSLAVARSTGVEIVVIEQFVSPDITLLAARAGTWGQARSQAIANGSVEVRPPAPSNTDLGLLPFVAKAPVVDEPVEEEANGVDDESVAENPEDSSDETGEPVVDEADVPDGGDNPDPAAGGDAGDGDVSNEGAAGGDGDSETPDEAEEPDVEDVEERNAPIIPSVPAQVDGRVPPPNGGPTAAQWDALRNCESTHNYQAINNTGTYRGAYQFSQQTWDWVSGIHWPHLVGIDPVQADPAWQDIMAYTLFAMRGWDQWPICGQHLL